MTPTTPAGSTATPANAPNPTNPVTATPETPDALNFAEMSDEALGEFLGLPDGISGKAKADEPSDPAEQDGEATEKEVAAALDEGEPETPEPDTAPTDDEGAEAKADTETNADTEKAAEKKAAFVVYDADGKAIDPATLPVAKIELTIAGKARQVDMPSLVRMAQSGGYNEVLQTEVKEAREIVPQLAKSIQEYDSALAARDRYIEQLLANPERYITEAESFAQAQTPEAEAQRLRQENEQLRIQRAHEQSTAVVAQQAQTLILPKLEALAAQYPEVTAKEVLDHFAALIRPYRAHGGGAVNAEHVPLVIDALDRDVAPWVHQLHEARAESKRLSAAQATAAKAAAATARKQASAQVTKAKAELAREIAPVGRTAPTAKPKARPRNANEAAQAALEDALSSIGA